MGGTQPADEELAAVGDINVDVAVHCVFAEQIDAELLARFREAPLSIKRDDVCEDATPTVKVHQLEELER